MDVELTEKLSIASDIVGRFGFDSLKPMLRACEALAKEKVIDVAILGQFKSGKSSLLNALLGRHVLPIGALPVTSVVTRVGAGTDSTVQVTKLNGEVESIAPSQLADFVSEAGNPGNRRSVAVVDVFDASMSSWPNIRLVDTPGLGSVWAHNTAASQRWMPNATAAMVAVSSERPLSEDDLRLIEDARRTAARVTIVLTKVDLLSEQEAEEVVAFIDRAVRERFSAPLPILRFSNRCEQKKWIHELQEAVLQPLAQNWESERCATLAHKLATIGKAGHEYLTLGVQSAERTEADRNKLRTAVLDEKTSAALIEDELQITAKGMSARTRPTLEEKLLPNLRDVQRQLRQRLAGELPTWRGNLAQQAKHYEHWLKQQLLSDLEPFTERAAAEAVQLVNQAEGRFRRIVEAFRDRLNHNVRESAGVTISPVSWEFVTPALPTIPISIGQTFMTHWDFLWWMLPMKIVGGLFQHHILSRAPDEMEKNVRRLVSNWSTTVDQAIADLRGQAMQWVEAELLTLESVLSKNPNGIEAFRDALGLAERLGTSCSV